MFSLSLYPFHFAEFEKLVFPHLGQSMQKSCFLPRSDVSPASICKYVGDTGQKINKIRDYVNLGYRVIHSKNISWLSENGIGR